MKRFFLTAFIVLGAAVIGLYAQETYVIKIKVQLANVRSEPDMSAQIIRQLKVGTLLEATQKLGDWFEIAITDDQGKAISGYVNVNVVDVISGGKAAEPAAKAPEKKEPAVQKEPEVQKEPPVPVSPPAAYDSETRRPSSSGFKIMGAFGSANMAYDFPATSEVDVSRYIKSRAGFGGGLGYESGSQLAFEIDLLYLQKGAVFKGSESGASFDLTFSFDEISLPLLLKFNLPLPNNLPSVYLLGGGEIAYLVQSKVKYSIFVPDYDVQETGTEDIKENINQIDYGAIFGGGVALPVGGVRIFLEARYHLGMANLQKTAGDYSIYTEDQDFAPKTKLLLFLAGIKF